MDTQQQKAKLSPKYIFPLILFALSISFINTAWRKTPSSPSAPSITFWPDTAPYGISANAYKSIPTHYGIYC